MTYVVEPDTSTAQRLRVHVHNRDETTRCGQDCTGWVDIETLTWREAEVCIECFPPEDTTWS